MWAALTRWLYTPRLNCISLMEYGRNSDASLNAMPAKITNKFNGQCTLMKFVWYLLHNSAGSFCAGICAFCASIFSGGLIDLRWFFVVKTIWRIFCVISFNYFWKFSRLWNLAWDFLGVWFLPPFDHPVTWNPEYLPNPPNPHQHHLGRFWGSRLYSYTTLWG